MEHIEPVKRICRFKVWVYPIKIRIERKGCYPNIRVQRKPSIRKYNLALCVVTRSLIFRRM